MCAGSLRGRASSAPGGPRLRRGIRFAARPRPRAPVLRCLRRTPGRQSAAALRQTGACPGTRRDRVVPGLLVSPPARGPARLCWEAYAGLQVGKAQQRYARLARAQELAGTALFQVAARDLEAV